MWTCAIVAEGEIVFPSYSSSPNYTAQINQEGPPQWEITNQDHLRHVQVMTFFPTCIHMTDNEVCIWRRDAQEDKLQFTDTEAAKGYVYTR